MSKAILVISDGNWNEDADGNYFAQEESFFNHYTSPEWDELVIKESDNQIVYSNIITDEEINALYNLIGSNYLEEVEKLNNNNIFFKCIVNGIVLDLDPIPEIIIVKDEPWSYSKGFIVNTLETTGLPDWVYNLEKYENIPTIEAQFIDDLGNFIDSQEVETTSFSLTNVLSDEILENYELIDVKKPTNGIASANSDNTTITWNIAELPYQKTETLEFRLKLKDTYNDESFKSISKISKSMTFTFADDEPVVVTPVVAIKGNEIVHISNPQTGDTIRKYAEIFSAAIGLYLITRFMRKYGTKKKKINF